MRTIISTGQGRLHLIDTARFVKKSGAEIRVITGWIPTELMSDRLLNLLGRIVGRKNISFGLRKRQPIDLNSAELKSCAFSEFFLQFLFLLSKKHVLSNNLAIIAGWKLFGWQSKRYIKDSDIFHVRSAAGQGGAIEKSKKLGMRVIVDQSAAHPNEIYNQLSKAYIGSINPFDPNSGLWEMVIDDCEKADCVLVNSEYIKKSFIENGFEESKIEVIPLGVRSDFFGLKTSYKYDSTFKLLYTGSISRWKGFQLLIELVEMLDNANIPFQFDILGSKSDNLEIPEWFIKHSSVKMHGHVPQDNLKSYLGNSDVYIFPSYCDGGAQSLREAMAAGLPVITNEKTGSQIVDGESGLIVPDDSSKAIYEALMALYKDEDLRKRLGCNAAKLISSEFTWEKYGERVTSLYSKLINC